MLYTCVVHSIHILSNCYIWAEFDFKEVTLDQVFSDLNLD